MNSRELRKFLRKYRLRDTEELIPPGRTPNSADDRALETSQFDPQDPGFVENPYPFFKYLRDNEPIQRGATGAWVLSRYADISDALIDNRLGNAPSDYATVNRRNLDRYLCARVANNILPFLDPPDHTAPRKLINQSFHQFVKTHPPPMEQIAADLFTELESQAELDLMQDFATPYSARVFCHLLGIDEHQIPELLEWSDWFFYLLTVIPSQQARVQIDHALEQLQRCFRDLVESAISHPGKDFVAHLLASDREQSALTQEQLVDNLMLLFADGVGNVDKGICAVAALLLLYPEQLELLRQKPDLLPRAVDECLRFESPAQFIGRVARQELVIQGQRIRKNDAVLLLLGSANRDPEQFEHPDNFDITRFPNAHLSFGRSRHACIGSTLVRLETQAAIKAFLSHLPEARLASPDLKWQMRMGHRWLAELKLVNSNAST